MKCNHIHGITKEAQKDIKDLGCHVCMRLAYTGQFDYDSACLPVRVEHIVEWKSIGALIAGILCGALVGIYVISRIQETLPEPVQILPELPTRAPTISPTPTPKQTGTTGIASYYSRAGCIGCSPSLTMANGQELDDNALTVAYNRAPLGTRIKVVNIANGQEVIARVTDTGGFEKIGRIIDLTIATRDAIGCSSLCKVEVIEL